MIKIVEKSRQSVPYPWVYTTMLFYKKLIILFHSGDSGSPLVVRSGKLGDILVGVASYVDIGEVCNSENNGPVVFMRVSYFLDWIQDVTGLTL